MTGNIYVQALWDEQGAQLSMQRAGRALHYFALPLLRISVPALLNPSLISRNITFYETEAIHINFWQENLRNGE